MTAARTPRPFIGMLFKCCQVYTRIYLNKAGSAYDGRCPRCGKSIRIEARPGGSASRFWSAE
jgi:PHP family Zn ribbon phosphoesterase